MTNNNRTTRSLGAAGAAAFLLLLTAGAALAISPDWKPGTQLERRQRAMRASQIAVMDIFGQNYGGADFSLVIGDLESHPADAGNAAFMSVPLSLANVYLNRYETGGAKADLDRAVLILGWVADRRDLWSGREHTGSVVSYLDISLARARAECDVGGYESAIDEAWSKAMALTAGEADALLETASPCGLTLLLAACADRILPLPIPTVEADLASRAALFATASSFLSADPRAAVWAENARALAASFPASECQPVEVDVILTQGALSKNLGDADAPDVGLHGRGVERVSTVCTAYSPSYKTAGAVDVVTPGDSLAEAIADSRVVAFVLSERFLWQFPPGSQCLIFPVDD